MPVEVIIVGGLLDTPSSSRQVLLDRLKNEVSDEVEWSWISCDAQSQFEVSKQVMRKLAEKLTMWRKEKSKNAPQAKEIIVIKLATLHGRTEGMLYQHWKEPIIPPADVRQSQEFIDWIRANLSKVKKSESKEAPKTVQEAKASAALLFANDLIFGADVNRGIAGLDEQAGPPSKILFFLEKLANLAKERREGRLVVSLLQWLRGQGIPSSGESETTKKNSAEMKKRTWEFGNGDTTEFDLHLKPKEGTSPDRCVRIYFEWCEKRKKFVVGWIGRHPV